MEEKLLEKSQQNGPGLDSPLFGEHRSRFHLVKIGIPAWFGSLLLHLLGILIVLFFIRGEPPIKGAPGVREIENVGIVLKTQSVQGALYADQDKTHHTSSQNLSEPSEVDAVLSDILQSSVNSFDPSDFLPPALENIIGAGQNRSTALEIGEQIGPIHGTNVSGGSLAENSNATVSVFGLEGTGNKFAFVFDRSASMSELDGRPIRAAKAELIRSLDSLKSTHQLVIIFYNNQTKIHPDSKQGVNLVYATDINKESAVQFIESITPAGGTDHEGGIIAASKTKPDVIFLLTDGELKDDLKGGQLERISRSAAGMQINVVQFGIGPEPPGRNYLKTLSQRNAGLYRYIDITGL